MAKLFSGKIYASVEGYYKSMNDIIGFEEGTNLFHDRVSIQTYPGKRFSIWTGVLVKKETGHLTGWLSYTLSGMEKSSMNWVMAIAFHRDTTGGITVAIVTQYALNKNWSVSAVWEFFQVHALPGGWSVRNFIAHWYGVDLLPVYALNSVRLANSHRLDLGIKFKSNGDKRFQSEVFQACTMPAPGQPIGISVEQKANGELKNTQPGLFGTIPFVSYGFKFSHE